MLIAKHKLEFKTGKRSAKTIVEASSHPAPPTSSPLPRITKMMALAIRLDHLIKSGQVTDQAELARVGHVSRARLTQIMDLNLLAPEVQEDILHFKTSETTKIRIIERDVRKIARTIDWNQQRRLWKSEIGYP